MWVTASAPTRAFAGMKSDSTRAALPSCINKAPSRPTRIIAGWAAWRWTKPETLLLAMVSPVRRCIPPSAIPAVKPPIRSERCKPKRPWLMVTAPKGQSQPLGRLHENERRSCGRLYILVHQRIPEEQRHLQLEHGDHAIQISLVSDAM